MSIVGSVFAAAAAILGGIAGLVLIIFGVQLAGQWWALPFLIFSIFILLAKNDYRQRHRVVPPTDHQLAMAALRRSRPLAIDAAPRTSVRGPRITGLRYAPPFQQDPALPASPSDSLSISAEDEDYEDEWDSLR